MPAPLVPTRTYDVDVVANELARIAQMAVQMPPSWDGAKVTHGLTGTNGENLGRVLPGRGIALASDLKSLGITKPIPHVYDKTLVAKCLDAFGGTRERMAMQVAAAIIAAKLGALGQHEAMQMVPLVAGAITTYDGIINGRANGKADDMVMYTASITTVASQWSSIISSGTKLPGGTFAPAAIPGGTVTNRATTGALSTGISNPTGTDKKYLITVGFSSSTTINMLMLVDILVAAGSISTNTTSAQTVNSSALTRYTGTAAAGNLMTLEVTTALGATASNVTVSSYTNSAGTTGRSTTAAAMTTSAIVGRLQHVTNGTPFIPFQAGDIGVRSVESITFSAAMGAGVCNLYIYRPLHFLPGVGSNVYVERDSTVQIDGLTELVVGTDSELGFLNYFVLPVGTASGNIISFLRTVAG